MTEDELRKYWGKKVKVVSVDGIEVVGLAAYFTSVADSDDDEEASITIEKDYDPDYLVGIMASEIKSIEVIKK
jgi:hypothetical protein